MSLNIWPVNVGEPLPTDDGSDRPCRAGMISASLIEKGHRVIWWTSSFDHARKRQRCDKDKTTLVNEQLTVIMLHAPGYRRNISVPRLINHFILGQKFAHFIKTVPCPDLILCSYPTIELSYYGAAYAKRNKIPVILDIRDLWPDIFIDFIPRRARILGKAALLPLYVQAQAALKKATGLIGVSEKYLEWGLDYAGRPKGETDRVFPLSYSRIEGNESERAVTLTALEGIGVDRSKIIVWFVGSFGRTYDLGLVIEAARIFQENNRTDVQFVLSGNGQYFEQWTSQASDLKNVVFTDWLNFSQIDALMEIASVGLAPYVPKAPQGLPNKFFEYLCAGLPIVSSLEGEGRKFLGEHRCGVTYTAGEVRSFVETLTELLGDRLESQRMGERGRTVFTKRYSQEIVYGEVVQFLEGLAGPAA